MTVESVGNIRFEDNAVAFINGSAFENGKVLVVVRLASNAEYQGSVTIDVAALGYQRSGVGIHESGTIEEVVRTERRKCPIGLLSAAPVALYGVKRAMVWREERLPGNQTVAERSVGEGSGRRIGI